jgi:hypothetical protein
MAETDREMDMTARLATLELRLAEVEARAAEAEARALEAEARAGGGPLGLVDAVLTAVLPAEARGHMRAARKEQLLAVRSLVDAWIERVDRKPDEPRRRRRRESISLEDA